MSAVCCLHPKRYYLEDKGVWQRGAYALARPDITTKLSRYYLAAESTGLPAARDPKTEEDEHSFESGLIVTSKDDRRKRKEGGLLVTKDSQKSEIKNAHYQVLWNSAKLERSKLKWTGSFDDLSGLTIHYATECSCISSKSHRPKSITSFNGLSMQNKPSKTLCRDAVILTIVLRTEHPGSSIWMNKQRRQRRNGIVKERLTADTKHLTGQP